MNSISDLESRGGEDFTLWRKEYMAAISASSGSTSSKSRDESGSFSSKVWGL